MEQRMNQALIDLTYHLIEEGSQFNWKEMDKLYSEELRIVRLDEQGKVGVWNKQENLEFFRKMKETDAPPLSTEAEIHYAEEKGDSGYVFLTRKMALHGSPEELKYHIEWKRINGKWKIIHENIYAQALKEIGSIN